MSEFNLSRDEINAKLTKARTAMREAEEALHSAIAKLRSSAQTLIHAEALDHGRNGAMKHIVGIASSNRSQWSGSDLCATNLIECAMRESALDFLHTPPPAFRDTTK